MKVTADQITSLDLRRMNFLRLSCISVSTDSIRDQKAEPQDPDRRVTAGATSDAAS